MSLAKFEHKTHAEYEQQLFKKEIDYFPLEEYVTSKTPILHECLNGHKWKVAPDKILANRQCPTCTGSHRKKKTNYKEELVEKNILYTPVEEYINCDTAILHECINGHYWKVTPNKILSGRECPECYGRKGFDKTKPAILYYIKIGDYYKIGVTTTTINKRFSRDIDKPITIIKIKQFDSGHKALELEKLILKEEPRITVTDYLKSGGNTELFLNPISIDKYIQCINNSKI
jgi:hypothetical protein